MKDTAEREEMEGIAGIIKGRRSIRKYRPDKVSREKILSLLADASFAPSACNLQAWHFIVVDDRGLIKKLVKEGIVTPQLLKAPVVVIATYNRNVTRENYANFQSCAAMVQNFHLLARASGLGTLWVCNFRNEEGIRRLFDIPETQKILALIEIGHPAEEPRAPARTPVETFVSFNRFSPGNVIPGTTVMSHWLWDDIVTFQKKFARRGYPLEKVTTAEKKDIAPRILAHLGGKKSLELLACSTELASEINRLDMIVDHHFLSEEIYYAARQFQEAMDRAGVTVSEDLADPALQGYANYILVHRVEHMPSEVFDDLIRGLSRCPEGTRLIVLFRNRYSWYGLYDFMVRSVMRKKGIDDIYFGSLRSQGPWKLRTARWMKKRLDRWGFKIVRREGFYCLPAYRFADSEWIRSKAGFSLITGTISRLCAFFELLFRVLRLNRTMGEEILLVSVLEGRERGTAS